MIFFNFLVDESEAEQYLAARRPLKPVNYDLNKRTEPRVTNRRSNIALPPAQRNGRAGEINIVERTDGYSQTIAPRQPAEKRHRKDDGNHKLGKQTKKRVANRQSTTALPPAEANRREGEINAFERTEAYSQTPLAPQQPAEEKHRKDNGNKKLSAKMSKAKRLLICLRKRIKVASIRLRKKIQTMNKFGSRTSMKSVKMEEIEMLRRANRMLNRRVGVEVIDDNIEIPQQQSANVNGSIQNKICESVSPQRQIQMQHPVEKKVDPEFSGCLEYYEVH